MCKLMHYIRIDTTIFSFVSFDIWGKEAKFNQPLTGFSNKIPKQ